MMGWVEVIAYFLTNEIRVILGLMFTAILTDRVYAGSRGIHTYPGKAGKQAGVAAGLIVTIPVVLGAAPAAGSALEAALICLILCCLRQKNGQAAGLRMLLFFAFFYELGIALWDFLISAWLGVLFGSPRFLRSDCMEYYAALLLVRLVMITYAVAFRHTLRKNRDEVGDRATGENGLMRPAAMVTAFSLLGLVSLSEQTVIRFSDDELMTWIFLDLILMFAVMMAHMERQRAMEEEISRLREEQAGRI
ncbi:hypothetical protein [Lachnoclostridium sp. An169]|uniref:hypothetical protein n=1 Tax=Lachnoclostridium sp. An169 TaxID=1965569 RepID=UPI00111D0EDE|nr:hypothetical protein [Lachnoclostridium sp. An169]